MSVYTYAEECLDLVYSQNLSNGGHAVVHQPNCQQPALSLKHGGPVVKAMDCLLI
jgi:hypothetical protein